MQKTWKLLKQIIGKQTKKQVCKEFDEQNVMITNPKSIAKGFNNFFVNIGPNLANKIKQKSNKRAEDYLNDINMTESLFLKPVTEYELIETVHKCKSKTSCDNDDINMNTVKMVFSSLIIPFLHICNLSFKCGKFPDKMKIAKVLPFFKTGEPSVYSNYRPVSLLSQFSKILEKLFNSRLITFIESYKLLCESQYGFRHGHSTSHAICELYEKLTLAIEKDEIPVGVFIDLRKAFDTIDHKILLTKLEKYGVRGLAKDWLSDYLNNRYQYVQYENTKSDQQKITCGVPQGSILGPTLFILYINDMHRVSNVLDFILFADDTSILFSGKDIDLTCHTLNTELNKLCDWFAVNKLSLNIEKTNYMIFGSGKVSNSVDIVMNEIKINKIEVSKFLGIIIDNKLNWKPHVNYLHSKISRNMGLMYKASKVLNDKAMYTLYSSFVLPYFQYCCEIWGHGSASNCTKLFLLQKRAIRIISKSGYREHTTPLFYNFKCLKLHDLVHIKTATFMFNVLHLRAPSKITELFKTNNTLHDHNTRTKDALHKQPCHGNLRSKAMSSIGVSIWNDLDDSLKSLLSLPLFKKTLKDCILTMYD